MLPPSLPLPRECIPLCQIGGRVRPEGLAMECQDHGAGTGVPPSYAGAGEAQGLCSGSDVRSEDTAGKSGGTWQVVQGGSAVFCFPLDEPTCCG